MVTECLNYYPNLNIPFDIYIDASDYQLGDSILQLGHPVAYWSRTLSVSKKNYTTMEKKLLAIVLLLKEYQQLLLGGELNIHTDHKNLTFCTMLMQHILSWRLYMEEFDITLRYIEGPKNDLAD